MIDRIGLMEMEFIYPSPLNPRKTFDQEAIQELSDNIKSQGLLQPIIVREKNALHYEIVCGERRYRACKLAGHRRISCIVKKMTDEEAFDAMITENLLRKDVNPLEEAIAFDALLKRNTVNDIALRFGKSPQFVRQRINLNSLHPEFKKLMQSDKITISMAQLLARLPEEVQGSIHSDIFNDHIPHLSQLTNYIEAKCYMYINRALFDTKLCKQCTNNTANQGLFDDFKKEEPRCTLRKCFLAKTEEAMIEKAKAYHKNGIVIVIYDILASAKLREALDKQNIGYSCKTHCFLKTERDPGENEAKAIRLCSYMGFCEESGVILIESTSTPKAETLNDKIISLKREDDNNLRIRDDNTAKDLRAVLQESQLEESNVNVEKANLLAMIIDLPLSQLSKLNINSQAEAYNWVIEAKEEDIERVKRMWAQYKYDSWNGANNASMRTMLNDLIKDLNPDVYNEIAERYESVYQQRRVKIEERFDSLGASIEDITTTMIKEYEERSGITQDAGYKRKKKEFVKIVSRVTKDNAERLSDIRKKFGFKSNYEINQYLMHCFLRVADPDNDPIMEPVPEEIESMFVPLSDFQEMNYNCKPKRACPASKINEM